MPRARRVVVPGVPHHVTHRGNRGQDVFLEPEDRNRYLSCLEECADEHGLRIWAYCLMTDHVHLVAVPADANSLGRAMHAAHTRYTVLFNSLHGTEGHLWRGRYCSCPLDVECAWAVIRYVERNPIRAGLVRLAHRYQWSSAAAHCGKREDPLLSWDLPERVSPEDWQEWLRQPTADETADLIRTHTRRGVPAGDAGFMKRVEGVAGRAFLLRPRGRPKG